MKKHKFLLNFSILLVLLLFYQNSYAQQNPMRTRLPASDNSAVILQNSSIPRHIETPVQDNLINPVIDENSDTRLLSADPDQYEKGLWMKIQETDCEEDRAAYIQELEDLGAKIPVDLKCIEPAELPSNVVADRQVDSRLLKKEPKTGRNYVKLTLPSKAVSRQ